MASKKEMEAVIRLAGVVDPSLQKALHTANKEIAKTMGKGNQSMAKLGKGMSKLGGKMTKAITLPLVALGAMSFKTFMEMDRQLRSIQATLGATPAQMEKITAGLKAISGATKYGALDAAKAFDAVVKSGKDAAQSMLVIPAALRMAAATGKDVGEATQFLTDSMNALDMGAEEINVYLDQVTKATQMTGLSFDSLSASLHAMGPEARRLKGGTVELAAALGVLASNGIEGSKGGRELTNIINALTEPSDKAAKSIRELIGSALDAEGDLRPLNEIFERLNGQLAGLAPEAKRAKLREIFGTNDVKAVEALMSLGSEAFVNLEDEIQYSALAAKEMAAEMEGGAAGAMKALESAAKDLLVALGEKLAPILTKIVEGITGFVNKVGELDPGTLDAIAKAGIGLAAAGPALKIAGGALTSLGLKGPLLKVASTALSAIAGTPALPILAVAGGILLMGHAIEKAHDAAVKAELDSLFGDIHLSAEDIKAIASTARTTFADAAANALEAAQSVEQAFAHLKNLDTELTIAVLKFPVGKELDEQTKLDLEALAGSYVHHAQKYLDDQQMAITLGIQAYAAAGTEEERASLGRMTDQIDLYFAGAQEAAAKKGKELRKALDDAIADGVIDAEEQKTIDRLRAELAQIINSATLLDSEIEMGKLSAKIGAGGLDWESITKLNEEITAARDAAKADITALADQNLGVNEALFRKGAITRAEADEYAATIRGIRDDQLKAQDMWAEELRTNLVASPTDDAFGDYFAQMRAFFSRDHQEFVDQSRQEWLEMAPYLTPEDVLDPAYAYGVIDGANKIWLEAAGRLAGNNPTGMIGGKNVTGAEAAALYRSLYGGDPGIMLRQYRDEYIAAGKEIPAWITEGIETWDSLEALRSIDELLRNAYPEATAAFDKLAYEPRIDVEIANAEEEAERLRREIEQREYRVRVTAQGDFGPNAGIKGYSLGGRATSASVFGESGPEWAIPEERSLRSARLLNAARAASGFTWADLFELGNGREGLGPVRPEGAGALSQYAPGGSGGDVNVTFSPQIIVQGGGSASDTRGAVMDALESAYPQFAELLERYITDRGRESYGVGSVPGLVLG